MQELKSVQDVCCAINDRASRLNADGAARERARIAALAQISQSGVSPGFIPSGPRKRGEGCDDENQGIVAADETPSGGARLRVTLLAAGFIIGPGGASIRSVSHKSGADIRSWSETFAVGGRSRRVRTIVMEGPQRCVVAALGVVVDAVERYKQLCEGKFCGKLVDRVQVIRGVEFFYSPPPRSAVPYAAALKPELLAAGAPGASTTSGPSLGLSISPGAAASVSPKILSGTVSPTSMAQKENFAAAVAAAAATAASPGMAKPLGSTSPRKPTFASITESHLNARVFDPSAVGGTSAEETAEELEGDGGPTLYGSGGSLDLGGGGGALTFHDGGSALAAALAGVEAQALLDASLSGYSAVPPPPPPSPHHSMDMASLGGYFPGAGGSLLHGGAYVPSYGAVQQPPISAGPLFGTMPGPLGYKPPPPAAPHPADLAAAVAEQAAAEATAQAVAAEVTPSAYTLFAPNITSYPLGPALLAGIWGDAGGSTAAGAAAGQVGVGDAELRAAVFSGFDRFASGSPFYNGLGPGMDDAAANRRPAVSVKLNTRGILHSAFEPEDQDEQ